MRVSLLLLLLLMLTACSQAQPQHSGKSPLADIALRQRWVDSVYSRLNEEERIGQLFMVAAYSGGKNANQPAIEKLIQAHQIGGLIFMQGGAARQAMLTNRFQAMAQVPLLLSMDAEWGLGMRLDSIINLPRQMMIGAANDTSLAYEMGRTVAAQCNRLGVHINFAPVVDVNNNPANPVINARSFGEDKYKVARLAIAYMRGMQDNGVMACAKHFPGHGDVSVDSHKDLPLIAKSRVQLDSLELYPFRQMIKAGIQSVMVAHLAVPVLEKEEHVPTTLSKNAVTGLLKNELGFKGLVFTDALDMKGVAKYYAPGEVDVRAFLAGNDVLLFSEDVPTGIAKIKAAISSGKASTKDLETRVRKILSAKYNAGLHHFTPIATDNITNDINQYTRAFNLKLAKVAVTVVRDRNKMLPLKEDSKVLEILVGNKTWDTTGRQMIFTKGYYASMNARQGDSYARAEEILTTGSGGWLSGEKDKKWDAIIVRVQNLSFYPGKNYGMDDAAIKFLSQAAGKPNVIITVMGNAYALKYVCEANTLICGYEDNPWAMRAVEEILGGLTKPKGSLPVTPECMK